MTGPPGRKPTCHGGRGWLQAAGSLCGPVGCTRCRGVGRAPVGSCPQAGPRVWRGGRAAPGEGGAGAAGVFILTHFLSFRLSYQKNQFSSLEGEPYSIDFTDLVTWQKM